MIIQIFVDITYLLNYIGLNLPEVLQDFLLSGFFGLSSGFIVSGNCNSSLRPSFILKINLLLILLMQKSFHVGAIIFNLLFLYCFSFFPRSINR